MTLGLRALALTTVALTAVVLPAQAAPEASPPSPRRATLTAWSVLPAATYVPGSETSGHWTAGNAAVPAPYEGQPVQGFSGTHALGDGSFLVLSDNGYGAKANSADFLLSIHRITPETDAADGDGSTTYDETLFTVSDPDHLVPWPIWRDGACEADSALPAGYVCPVADRVLTGWDFDPESLQVAQDGTFWVGEEFGPFLLHLNVGGQLIEAPIPTPGVRGPANPTLGSAVPDIASSKGFEGMAISPNGQVLHPMLEGATAEDKAAGLASDLRIYTVRRGAYADRFLRYRMEGADNALGDLIQVNDHEALVIERDNGQGATARFKRIYLVDLRDTDHDGYVAKRPLVDLLDVANPDGLSPYGDPFRFSFFTIEDVEILDGRTIAVMNDNNFPAAGGRSSTEPDQNEYLEITLPRPLRVDRRLLPQG
ncbi:esterase-like activity of phytase family protein [Nocardioides sp.]|uniref:esterase-like activity of phytase family protein n=1 Tax=Nocardioides sp. TaxID=35761 RepID=UPI00286E61B8|nr:esterase-like activity of phytase family protein [Nocardioides sp.]